MKEKTLLHCAPIKASNLIGADVVNPQGECLGEIREVVLDPSMGRIAYVVVTFARFLCGGEKLFAIPFSAFHYSSAKHEYMLDVSKERLAEAPGFDPDRWPSMSDEAWNRSVHTYYERPPYWDESITYGGRKRLSLEPRPE